LPDGFHIKKGDSVDYQPLPMGRMKFLWGDDAEEFRPERWLDKKGQFVPQSPCKFTAFQVGTMSQYHFEEYHCIKMF
jgi:cytochrome P450